MVRQEQVMWKAWPFFTLSAICHYKVKSMITRMGGSLYFLSKVNCVIGSNKGYHAIISFSVIMDIEIPNYNDLVSIQH